MALVFDLETLGAHVHPSHEVAVDLDRPDREPVEVAERGVPGPEVVHETLDAARTERLEHLARALLVVQDHVFSHLELEP